MKTVRIHKFLSQMGIASRRKAEILINEKRIKINGQFAQIGQKISDLDVVEFDGQKINKKPKIVWYALNKPKNYITSRTDPQNRPTIMEFFDKNSYLFPVGRLDFETTGLILVTNDGETSNKLLHPSSKIQRTYLVKTDFNLNDEEINFLNNNEIYLDNVKSVQKVQKVASRTYIVKIWQGSNHHVKKIFISVSKKVLMLRRLSFATIELGNLKPGEKRKLSQAEILSLKNIF